MLRLHAAEFQLDPEWLVAMGHSAGDERASHDGAQATNA